MPQLLMERIKIYNQQYRQGSPQIDDEHYDALLEEVQEQLNSQSYLLFRESLGEQGGSVKLKHIAGSLRKVTYGTDQLEKWINSVPREDRRYFISAKLDGMGYIATYVNGVLISVTTTGDGETAEDITNTGKYCLPTLISVEGVMVVRGELVLTKEDAVELGYKNARNGVVGLMKKKTPDFERIHKVKGIAYQIMNLPDQTYEYQYDLLKQYGFEVPYFFIEYFEDYRSVQALEENWANTLECWKTREYLLDGLVISQINSYPENVKLPTKTVAFKVNNDTVRTTVVGMDISTSKDGVLNGVALLSPVEINGTTVSRAAIYNFDNVKEKGIGTGAEVIIIKAGEIIPKIIEVVKTADIQEELYWSKCPECEMDTIHDDSVNMICPNIHCDARKYGSLETFVKNCGIKGASETSFRNWGISNFWEMVYFIPMSKGQIKFFDEFEKVVFGMPEEELFTKFNWTGAGQKTVAKYIEHLSLDGLIEAASIEYEGGSLKSHPEGCGELTWLKIVDKFDVNYRDYKLVIQDERYKPFYVDMPTTTQILDGKSFCCTGKVSRTRKEIEADIVLAGGVIKSVSKNLDYLVAGEKAGSKLAKAEKLGIKVITESELEEMLKG